jgi:hypothetical protein
LRCRVEVLYSWFESAVTMSTQEVADMAIDLDRKTYGIIGLLGKQVTAD